MSALTCLFVISALLAAVAIEARYHIFYKVLSRRPSKIEDVDRLLVSINECRAVVNFQYAGSLANDVKQRLILRERPNRRLVRAFGLMNSFTTTDIHLHRAFLRVSREWIAHNSSNWGKIFRDSTRIVNAFSCLELDRRDGEIRIDAAARILCFHIVAERMYSWYPSVADFPSLMEITRTINETWVQSKTESSGKLGSLKIHRLFRILQPGRSRTMTTTEYELGRIMPAYETLWRVVLLTYVMMAHRRGRDEAVPLSVLCGRRLACHYSNIDAESQIGDTELEARSITKMEASALRIAKEGLRLFPSTKRIYRASMSADQGHMSELAADVEACHRDTEVWGQDAMKFDPERFFQLTKEQRLAYMPFGLHPHICPASNGFGEKLVLYMTLALDSVFGEDKTRLIFHSELDNDRELPLPTGRLDAADWRLKFI